MRTGTVGMAIVSIVSLSFAFKVYKDNKQLHEELEGSKIATALATQEAERYKQLIKKLKRERS